jgi:MFS family permease
VPTQPLGVDGWRWLFVIGALGALNVWILRRNIPESPRWLESVGRIEEANAVLATFKNESSSYTPLSNKSSINPIKKRVLFGGNYAESADF